jgi:homeobox-leucine zipper protein
MPLTEVLKCVCLFLVIGRCREKQRKESSRMQTVNRKLTAMNKLLMEENDRLQKQLSRLIFEKEAATKSLKTHIHNVSSLPCL